MTTAIVTPWLNHPELWDDYQRVIEDAQPEELLIVDNASDPPLEFATITLERNLGFAGGSNAGLEAATADVVVFLNSDVALTQTGWLQTLTAELELDVLVGAMLRVDAHTRVDGQIVPYLDGWCLAGLRDQLVSLGGFDDTLMEPSYYSDNMLCLEARAAGMTLREVPVGLRHKGGVTSQPASNPLVHQASVANRQRYLDRARELLVAA